MRLTIEARAALGRAAAAGGGGRVRRPNPARPLDAATTRTTQLPHASATAVLPAQPARPPAQKQADLPAVAADMLAELGPATQQPSSAAKKKSARQRRSAASSSRETQPCAVVPAAAATAAAAQELQDATARPRPGKRSGRRESNGRASAELPSKEADVMGWYAHALRAAEHAHRTLPGKRGAPTLGHAAMQPAQEWLDERLAHMGFVFRSFPQLLPLDLLLDLGAGETTDGVDASSLCTSHDFAEWARTSGGSLPLLASQWHDVDRWDLQNAGLLLHESHAVHEWEGTADEHARTMSELYEEFAREVAAVPVVVGRSPISATLSGAAASYTVEAMAGKGRALQVAHSHHLADNYSRALGALHGGEHLIELGSGLRSSMLGSMALVHGDDAGLVLPPTLAPVQVMVTPITTRSSDRRQLGKEAERIRRILASAGVRVVVDDRRLKPGVRFRLSEQLGATLRIEVGPRDIQTRTCVIAQRMTPGRAGKVRGVSTEADALVDSVLDLLGDVQRDMRASAAERLATGIVDVSSFMELREVVEDGKWARGPWAGSLEDEAAVFDETGATLRCIPLQQPVSMWSGYSTCLYSGYQASEVAIFARAL